LTSIFLKILDDLKHNFKLSIEGVDTYQKTNYFIYVLM